MPEPEVTPAPDQPTDPAQNMPELSPEEKAAAELEAAREQTEHEEQRRLDAEKRLSEVTAAKRRLDFENEVRDAVANSGIKFYLRTSELIRLMSDEPGVDLSGERPHLDGKPTDLDTLIRAYADRHSTMLERTREDLQRERETKQGAKSKSELKTWAEKSAYIDKFGLQAFERLPLHPVTNKPLSQMTAAEYAALPRSEKIKHVDHHGADGVARIIAANERNRTK
jgi:hypothetical protein